MSIYIISSSSFFIPIYCSNPSFVPALSQKECCTKDSMNKIDLPIFSGGLNRHALDIFNFPRGYKSIDTLTIVYCVMTGENPTYLRYLPTLNHNFHSSTKNSLSSSYPYSHNTYLPIHPLPGLFPSSTQPSSAPSNPMQYMQSSPSSYRHPCSLSKSCLRLPAFLAASLLPAYLPA